VMSERRLACASQPRNKHFKEVRHWVWLESKSSTLHPARLGVNLGISKDYDVFIAPDCAIERNRPYGRGKRCVFLRLAQNAFSHSPTAVAANSVIPVVGTLLH
jgi:hypothetical protein